MSTKTDAARPPATDEYFNYYKTYIQLVPDGDLLKLAEQQIGELSSFFQNVSESDSMTIHAPYLWSIKQVVGHLIDAERIFANRLHRFASGDLQALPGMNQDPYITNNDYETPSLKSLVDELLFCRQANLLLLRRIKPQSWDNVGVASDHPITVRALAYIMVGHIIHHMQIVRRRLAI